ncbi:MAG TPA: chemotaxis response regulator protein-glutamate methylesterase [Thermoanaerobaculia bacterium]|nr:chemotaxis response regulator protein-glutamate methylesterase [Thermoanaerobaculia bacterium]
MTSRLQVLVVDDSAIVRQVLTSLLSPRFDVDTAADPIIARKRMERRRPGVIVLDLNMPRVDGITFLREIMREDPVPVVICSSAATRGSEAAMRALEEGAVDIILKPQVGVREFLEEAQSQLTDTLRAAASARVKRRLPKLPVTPRHSADVVLKRSAIRAVTAGDTIVAVGASTGGTEALREIIESLPADAPGMVVVQHMPEGFTAAFAKRLDMLSAVEVKEAEDGDVVARGRVLIAPGDRHLLLRRNTSGHFVQTLSGPPVSRHRPSVDVLFRSVAQAAGANAIGVLLTGMGDDGAQGLSEMHATGATTIAQDEATSVVFGMPKEAIQRGAVTHVMPLDSIAAAITRFAKR